MIITKLQGGLANQIFQWAYARNLSIRYNTDLYLDTSFYNIQTGCTIREYSLDKFPNIKVNIIDNTIYNNHIDSKKQVISMNDYFKFKELNYNDSFNYYLNGYWQSEKYFIESSDIIRKELSPSEEILNKLNKTPLIDGNSVSLHIRRTDYVTSNGYHPVQSIDYYNKGLEIIGDYDNIFVFSDDIEWCKNNLNFKNIIFMEGFSDIEDLWLMSLCKHNIIVNSSFSWWGAWLNNNLGKKIIAPKKWFGSNLNTSDIIPNKWIKI